MIDELISSNIDCTDDESVGSIIEDPNKNNNVDMDIGSVQHYESDEVNK